MELREGEAGGRRVTAESDPGNWPLHSPGTLAARPLSASVFPSEKWQYKDLRAVVDIKRDNT